MKRRFDTSDHGAALPLVIIMTVLLAVLLTSTAMLTQSTLATVRNQSLESSKRAALVSWALQNAVRDLTPPTGRLLGVDPRVDPAGSCVGQLGPYTNASGQVVSVDCVQSPDSGFGSAMSSLLLYGGGSDCGTGCVTGQDGGLRLTSNDALNFSGILINVAGAWQGKNANAQLLNPLTPQTSVLQPDLASGCPASGNGFVSSPVCACPLLGADASKCYQRNLQLLKTDIASYSARVATAIAASTVSGGAQIPKSCASPVRWDPADATSPWVIPVAGGVVGPTEIAALSALTSGKNECIGNGASKQTPALALSGVLRFQDSTAGSPMAPATMPTGGNTWTIASSNAVVIAGTPVTDASTGAIVDCNAAKPGAMLQFAGSTYLRIDAGRMLLCPPSTRGVVLAAPAAEQNLGFTWQGVRTEPLLATLYGQSGGEVVKAHGVLFAPAGYLRIESQSNRTEVALGGGAVIRALTLTSNPSSSTQGDFYAPTPSPSGQREVQLRFWDVTRGRDLGIVQVVINDAYPTNPAFGYVIKVWRTMW